MQSPLVSIIIPCYNHGIFIPDAIASIEAVQSLQPSLEVIILDDGSTDPDTIRILDDLSGKGYHVHRQQNAGLGAARNAAVKLAKGKYILPLDSDNKVMAPYVTDAISIMEADPKISVVYADLQRFGDDQEIWRRGEFNLQRLMLHNFIDACAVYRRSMWEELGGYDEKMPVMGFEDWEYWMRAAFTGKKFHYLQKIGFHYRVSGDSMITKVSAQKFDTVVAYLNEKHRSYLGPQWVRARIMETFTKKRSLFFKLFLSINAPWLIRFMKRTGLIKSDTVL